ncbi:hypothetical protein AVEN_147840-1 [Araneus ventricosus]|uniref:Uncharacterized protein n=1 Tax=Araneus ventricosus TaxID=182803 RepID=A0A4Y2CR53_ARAVE|nr:hypothetical protein AVEN_147840-1 [Araneus ventricosus]
MGVTREHMRAERRMFGHFPTKCCLESLLGLMWLNVFLEQHYSFREFASALIFDDLFRPQKLAAALFIETHTDPAYPDGCQVGVLLRINCFYPFQSVEEVKNLLLRERN